MILELAALLILSQVILGLYLWYQVKDLYRYPNLFGFPVIGNLYYFYKGLCFKSLETLYRYEKEISDKVGNGLYFAIIKGKVSVVLSCPHLFEEIAYHPDASGKALSLYGAVNPLVKGLFTYCPNDADYKMRRKEMNNSLSKSSIDGPFLETFTKFGRMLSQTFKENKDNVDLLYHSTIATINIFQETHFGEEEPMPESRRFYKNWILLTKVLSMLFVNPVAATLFSITYKFFDNFLQKNMDLLREQTEGSVRRLLRSTLKDPSPELKSLPLSVVIALRNKQRKQGLFELRKELYELLAAATFTSTHTLAGSFAILAVLPEIQEKVWKEQYEIFGNSKRDPNVDDLRKMTYLDKFFRETVRFFSAPFVGKDVIADIKACGVNIPAGSVVFYLLDKVRNDPKYWKDPEKFNPEHDYENKPKFVNPGFGVGFRSCPGKYYALQEFKAILSVVVRNFKFSSSQKFEDFKFKCVLLPFIDNLKPVQVEPRTC